jgi:N-acetylglucosaminyldiphosphoundecaprenol N-acetyl-beta-D-mannosaminyltransferase
MTLAPQANASHFKVLGVRVDAVQIPEVVSQMERWIQERGAVHFIAATGMHGIMEAQQDAGFRSILEAADLVVPDGMPLVWLGRCHGHGLRRRVYGPELMETFCRATGPLYRHFFYGGRPGVADRVADVLKQRCGINAVGTYSPPFRPLNDEENAQVSGQIQGAAPDVVWVGLSTPKQEAWMCEQRHRLTVPLMVGVGAGFDFIAGTVKQSPAWMQENGLEWLFRLIQEPRRLWRRYLVLGPQFVWKVCLELLKVRCFL